MNSRAVNHDACLDDDCTSNSNIHTTTDTTQPSKPTSALWRKAKSRLTPSLQRPRFAVSTGRHPASSSIDERRELLSDSDDDEPTRPRDDHLGIEIGPDTDPFSDTHEEDLLSLQRPGIGMSVQSNNPTNQVIVDIDHVAQLTHSNIGKLISRGDHLEEMRGKAARLKDVGGLFKKRARVVHTVSCMQYIKSNFMVGVYGGAMLCMIILLLLVFARGTTVARPPTGPMPIGGMPPAPLPKPAPAPAPAPIPQPGSGGNGAGIPAGGNGNQAACPCGNPYPYPIPYPIPYPMPQYPPPQYPIPYPPPQYPPPQYPPPQYPPPQYPPPQYPYPYPYPPSPSPTPSPVIPSSSPSISPSPPSPSPSTRILQSNSPVPSVSPNLVL
ncbi:hypothetical protein BASA60_005810 [Batrachochytrium salamandrivorans]|nr:hypothetical protein BASA60_005810 [Batrachochytrium salamandrivorans]